MLVLLLDRALAPHGLVRPLGEQVPVRQVQLAWEVWGLQLAHRVAIIQVLLLILAEHFRVLYLQLKIGGWFFFAASRHFIRFLNKLNFQFSLAILSKQVDNQSY